MSILRITINDMQAENENKPVSRKKFVIWGVGVLSVFTATKFLFRSASQKQTKRVKMLTHDGKLVEVEVSKLPAKRKKVSVEEIQNWVQKKTSKS